MKHENRVISVIKNTIWHSKCLSLGIVITVAGAVISALLPPLILEKGINYLAGGMEIPMLLALAYFALIALTGILESTRESLLTIFGQRITHNIRSQLCAKLSRLSTDTFVKQEPGVIASRFVGDTDTVETLFTSGIISMAADFCKVISIFAVIFVKNQGLAILLLFVIPVLFCFTRFVQKRMLKAQIANRKAVAKVTNHVPETISTIRTIHTLGKEKYMREKYDAYIEDSYRAMEKTNFYDAVYSPVILILNAVIVAVVLLLSASGNMRIQQFFGMSVGTAVAIISYVSQIFGPLESIGMEIQTIQSAVAGVHRIDEFLALSERWETEKYETWLKAQEGWKAEMPEEKKIEETDPQKIENGKNQMPETKKSMGFDSELPCIELKNVCFSYEKGHEILNDVSFTVVCGEHLTLAGRTGAGKSTIFKLLLGLYQPQSGNVRIQGQEASRIPDMAKRGLFGYVEQSFRMVPGTVEEQITLFDKKISHTQVEEAAKTAGIHEAICSLEKGYETPCTPALFSQGQWQLLSIARAIAAEPEILLLDEITANLDAETEQTVLSALRNASKNRTVLSISHRLYEQNGGRIITI